ncbi:hypothetical protein [Nocardia gamkensis]|uniref:Uncharacterized protein n=1 Tax=Nocardia gamkensis TaxID=352869 RepID=A0A7X6R1S8_9NOCA|nr:hypothetical protein [Nocardia gamkensis]NKY25526.1 hypothetical protein [Nocardia gamkensis]NQE69715.1 hypothetical protein [Nocardia gamkensis]
MMKDLRHIHIGSGALRLDYQTGATQARNVADELAQYCPRLTMTVDDNVREDLPLLPYAALRD